MKKFMNQFMKLTMLFATINAAYLVKVYAQEHDYAEINSRSAVTASSQHNSRNSQIVNFLFATKLQRINLPKNRKLTGTEKEQKQLLKCIVKFIDKRKGLYKGPEIINGILMQAMDSERLTADSFTLNTTTDKCWDAYNNLFNFKKKETKESELKSVLEKLPQSSTNPAEAKAAQFIARQYNNRFTCIAHEISASAAFAVGAGVGGSLLKCLNVSGIVRNYIGPKIEFIGGFGAKVEYAKKEKFEDFTSGLVAVTVGSSDPTDSGSLVLGLGAANNAGIYGYSSYEKEAQMAGLGIFNDGSFVTLNIRVLNSFRNWSYVLDQLK